MRVGIQTWGSEGDLRPFFALAEGLARRGHVVSLAYSGVDDQDHSARLAHAPFRHQKAGALGMTAEQRADVGRRVFSDRNAVRQMKAIFAVFMDPMLDAMTDAAESIAQDADVVVHHMIAHPAAAAAEKHRRPTIAVYTAPMIATRHLPVPGAPDLGVLNLLGWKLALGLLDQHMLPAVQKVRARLGLPPVKKTFDQLNRSTLDLFTASPALLERPSDWPTKVRVCGFLNPVHSPSDFTPPPGLDAFFAAGPPPVFIGFGSMAIGEQDAAGLFRLVRDAVTAAGVRAIVQLAGGASEGPVFAIGAAPHDALFPRCAAVVHHGGTGTTQSALRAGKPSVVVAHITDQFLWGKVLFQRGLGPRALARRSLTVKGLAAALREAVGTASYATNAAAIGEKLRAEDGVATAVTLIEEAASR